MKKSANLLTISLLILYIVQIFPQEEEFLSNRVKYSEPLRLEKLSHNKLPEGIYTVGNGAYFPTIDSAFNKLSVDGIEGSVTLELIDDLYTATSDTFGFLLDGPILGSGPGSRVTIRPAIKRNVTIEGSGEAVLNFRNINYLTVDGIGLEGSTTLKIHANQNVSCPFNDGISFLNNSRQNVVQNVIIECEDYTRHAGGIVFYHESGNFMPDSNLIQNNFIKKSAMGILVGSTFYKATGNIIRGNIIGSETDSLISIGINLVLTQYSIVENNIIQNIRSNSPQLPYSLGLASVAGTAETIRNNVVHNVSVNDGNYGGMGIFLNGTPGNSGIINSVYNNMVYDIRSSSPDAGAKVSGIVLKNQSYTKIYFNSVYLNGSGANQRGSAALFIDTLCSNIKVKNNILINVRDEYPYSAYSIFSSYSSTFVSDYNDLLCESRDLNSLVKAGGIEYKTISDWQSKGQDIHSITHLPDFVEPDLHIRPTLIEYISLPGTSIGGIDFDFDWEQRDPVVPKMGADEFVVVPEVTEENFQPAQILLEQNYPNPFNPSTTIRYSIPTSDLVTLKVYDALGNEIATLVDEEKTAGSYEVEFSATGGSASDGNAYNLPSGIYFYNLQAGSFVETKKMILLK